MSPPPDTASAATGQAAGAPGGDDAGARVSRGHAWAIAITATLVMAVSYVDRQTFAALAPTITHDLHIRQIEYGVLVSAFSVAYLVGAPLAGWAVDKLGARRGLIGSVLLWSLVAALHALVPTFAVLFVLRIALGTAESPSFPAAAQAVQRTLPPRQRAAGFGMLFSGSSIGAMIAAPLAIAFHVAFGWRVAFLGTAAVGLLWIPCWIVVTSGPRARALLAAPPDPPPAPPRADERGAPGVGYRDAAIAPAGTQETHGLIELFALLKLPEVQRAVLLVLVTAPTMNFVYNWLPKYLVETFGMTQASLAAYLWVPPILFDAGAIAFGAAASLLRRRDEAMGVPKGLIGLGGVLCAGMGFMAIAPGPASAVALASLGLFGGGACYALLTSDMLARVDPRVISRAGGLTAASQSLAFIVANLAIGAVLQRTHSYAGVVVALAVVVVPGTVAWLAWPMPKARAAG